MQKPMGGGHAHNFDKSNLQGVSPTKLHHSQDARCTNWQKQFAGNVTNNMHNARMQSNYTGAGSTAYGQYVYDCRFCPHVGEHTWLAKPTPAPRQTRPMMSMARSWAKAHRMAPTQKEAPPMIMTNFLPPMREIGPVKKVKKAPARGEHTELQQ